MTDAPTRHWIGNASGTDLDGATRLADVTVIRDRAEIELTKTRHPVMSFDLDGIRKLRMLLAEAEAGITGVRVYAMPEPPPPNVTTVWTGARGDLIVQWRRTGEDRWESSIFHVSGGVPSATTLPLPWERVIAGYGRALDVSPDAPGLPDDI